MDLKNYDWSAVLSGVGKVATVFNPVVGGGLIVASEVLDKFNTDTTLSDNKILENDVLGLTRCAEILESNIRAIEQSQIADYEELKLVAFNLRSLNAIMIKTSSIMK